MHPDYAFFMAAKWLNTPPWELMRQSTYWRDEAIAFQADDAWAAGEHQKREEARMRSRAGR